MMAACISSNPDCRSTLVSSFYADITTFGQKMCDLVWHENPFTSKTMHFYVSTARWKNRGYMQFGSRKHVPTPGFK